MDNEHYAYVLGALARLDRKIDYLIEQSLPEDSKADGDEFEEEFDI